MRFRHSALSLALTLAAAACATSGADNLHGPTFGDAGSDAGGSVDADGGSEAALDAGPTDATAAVETSTTEAGDDATADASREAATEAGGAEAGPTEAGSTCSSTMAVLAAGGSAIAQAVYGNGQWSAASQIAGGASAAPSLVPFGSGYLAAFTGAGAAGNLPLEWTAYTGSWSQPAHVAAALAQGTPALAVTGTTAHVVYWGSNSKFYHGTYGGSWDAASDPVQAAGGAQSFGPSAPAAAAVGSTVVAAQSGQDGTVYDQPWSGSWQAAAALGGSSVITSLSPAIVALNGGGADLMIVLVHAGDAGSYYLQYATRTGGTWSAPADVYATAGTIAYASTMPALAALPGGKAVLAWQGGSSPAYAYVSIYDPASGWTAPIAASSDTLLSPPSVAPGVCGAQVVMAYAKTGGTVQVVTMSGGAWGTPVPIAGASGMQWAAVAVQP
jgi:hypothetical protein